jgi:hypothetical protein
MTVLLAGFDGLDTERISVQLREAGFSVVGASGRESSRTLATSTSPRLVVVPDGAPGEKAWSWLVDLLTDARVVSVAANESAGSLMGRLRQVSAAVEADGVIIPSGEDAPVTALPGLPTGMALETTAPALLMASAGPLASARAASGAPDLAAKLSAVRFGDYHQILEVEPGATAYVIDEQRDHLLALYSPTGWPGPVSAGDIPLLEEAQRGISEAHEILGSATLRELYDDAHTGAPAPRSWPTG